MFSSLPSNLRVAAVTASLLLVGSISGWARVHHYDPSCLNGFEAGLAWGGSTQPTLGECWQDADAGFAERLREILSHCPGDYAFTDCGEESGPDGPNLFFCLESCLVYCCF